MPEPIAAWAMDARLRSEPALAAIGLGLALRGAAALGCWLDGLGNFRTNLEGHAPSMEERLALRLT